MSIFGSMYLLGRYGGASSSAFSAASAAESKAGSASQKVDDLAARCDQLVMVCEAMWTILRDKLGVTDEELVTRVNDIDLSDGKLDGKVRKTAVSCPKCGRTIARRFQKCIYCGQPVVHDPFA